MNGKQKKEVIDNFVSAFNALLLACILGERLSKAQVKIFTLRCHIVTYISYIITATYIFFKVYCSSRLLCIAQAGLEFNM